MNFRLLANCIRIAKDGGPGSGNFGHSGRPGKVGGSSKNGGGVAYRTQTTKGGYVGIQKAKSFSSIARQARSAKDYKSFVHSLSGEQYEKFVSQYHNSGTKEDIEDYTKRFIEIAKKQPPQKQSFKGTVDGKDISQDYNWDGKPFTDPSTGQVIDEEIENAMYVQGYLGAPRVVTQEEFDRIVKENPNIPLLYRSFAGANAEQLQDFNEQLESGEWYVDCGTGGAGFGQGMYCAGVYPYGSGVRKLEDITRNEMLSKRRFVSIDGEMYMTAGTTRGNNGVREFLDYSLSFDEDDRYCFWDGEKMSGVYIAKSDASRVPPVYFVNEKTGEEIDKADAEEFDGACLITKIDVEKRKKRLTEGAIEEMKHYKALNIGRVLKETEPDPPEGMGKASSSFGDSRKFFWYDPNKTKKFGEEMPKPGERVAMIPDSPALAGENKTIWEVKHIEYDGKMQDVLVQEGMEDRYGWPVDEIDPIWVWSKIEGECEDPKLDPVASTRLMTLDPSAKVITYNELMSLRDKARTIRHDAEQVRRKKVNDYLEGKPFELVAIAAVISGETLNNDSLLNSAANYRKEHPEEVEKLQAFMDKAFEEEKKDAEEAEKWSHLTGKDPGVAAALLGYDAINAEGHGQSDSYTVVLNRTKVILSEQMVDTRGN